MLAKLIGGVLYLTWVLFVVLTPVLGVWLASSLIAFHGGPASLAIAGGVLLFPVLPLLWEWRATRAWEKSLERRRQLVGAPKRSFTLTTRLVARTLFLNLVFLAVLAVWFPKVAFPAVATRGDWFLDDNQGPAVEKLRADLHSAAAGLEWLYELATPNPYKKKGDDAPIPDSVQPVKEDTDYRMPTARRWIPGSKWPQPEGPGDGLKSGRPADPRPPPPPPDGPPPTPDPEPGHEQPEPLPEPERPSIPQGASWAVGDTHWPWAAKAEDLAFVDDSSLEAVGRSIAARESDPFRRVKMLHDWVVTHYRYDSEALRTMNIPAQDAQTVFGKRIAVCEGYARTLVALGKFTGDDIVYLTGDVREESGEAMPFGHAWNAVHLKGSWYLIDATWDDPVTKDGTDVYRTDYLFIPPSLAIYDHLPDHSRWQLLRDPLSRGDFLRQPLARPSLAREGLTLTRPERSTVEVDGPITIELSNPRRLWVLVHVNTPGGRDLECGVSNDAQLHFTCALPPGVSTVRLFDNAQRSGMYSSIASIRATRR